MPSGRFDWLIAAASVMLAVGCGDATSTPKPSALTGASGPSVGSGAPPTASRFGELSSYAPPLAVVEKPPAVQVLLPSGQPLAGAQVSFAVTAGGGVARDTLVFTDTTGVATTRWTLGPGEVMNTIVATATYRGWSSRIAFSVQAVRMDGTRYDLVQRDGKALGPGETGFMILANDSTYRTVWTWGAGADNPYVAINAGRFTRTGSTFAFTNATGDYWADGVLENDAVTFSYDDYLDTGSHYVIVEVYKRTS
jgi:hypothetical protein